jgi:hypothetical protein
VAANRGSTLVCASAVPIIIAATSLTRMAIACAPTAVGPRVLRVHVRVRVEIMGSQNSGIVGKYQPVLIMINPMIFTRTRMCV